MERSRTTVEYNYLPGQVFEHEADGVHCLVREIDGFTPELNLKQVLETLELRLAAWPGDMANFPRPVTTSEDSFRLVTPRSIAFDVWPRLLWCSNRSCGAVFRVEERHDIDQRTCHVCHRGHYRQLPYYMVHSCGARRQLQLPQCPTHGNSALSFEDTGSFVTAQFRCRKCALPFGMEFLTCSCGRGTTPTEKRFRMLTARDSRAFYGHHLTLVNVPTARLTRALAARRGPHWALGHYLGTIPDLTGMRSEVEGRANAAPAEGLAALVALLEASKGADPATYATMKATLDSLRGENPALEHVEAAISHDSIDAARKDRRSMERAWLFLEDKIRSLTQISDRYRANAQPGMAARLDAGQARARRIGLARIAVVHDFPIAQVGFGFTREYANERALLLALDPGKSAGARKHPLVAVEAHTEGVYVELDAAVLWQWCRANGWTGTPTPATDVDARVWVLNTTLGAPDSDAAIAIRRATHVFAHVLIQALAGLSSLGPNSVAEYLMEPLGAFIIYASSFSSFNLGALITLAEQHLETWLAGAEDQVRTCVHDPVCLVERGGCHKCIALAFGCERFNKGLHRGYLVGGGNATFKVTTGFLASAAARSASASAASPP